MITVEILRRRLSWMLIIIGLAVSTPIYTYMERIAPFAIEEMSSFILLLIPFLLGLSMFLSGVIGWVVTNNQEVNKNGKQI